MDMTNLRKQHFSKGTHTTKKFQWGIKQVQRGCSNEQ